MSIVSQTTTCLLEAKKLPYVTLDTGLSDEVIKYQPFDGMPNLEDVQMYNKGGYHPVHIGDILDGRFEVVHKLGSGSFGIVWLCRDINLKRWRAVKIKTADQSSNGTEEKIFDYLREQYAPEELEEKHISIPLEQFWLKGPNGHHSCFVMPVLGWSISNWRLSQKDYESQTNVNARNVCRQITESMHFLHRNGICHGDFKPGNILMKIEGIDDLDIDQLLEIMGEPECAYVETISGQPSTPSAPEYCVIPPDEFWCEKFTTNSIAIVDFGESFFVQDPPRSTGIPNLYAAPEVMFQGTGILGFHSDLWALACTLYEVRTGSPLFKDFYGSDLSNTVRQIESYLGPLPQKYRTKYVEMLRDIPGASGLSISNHTSQSDKPTTPSKRGSRPGTPDSNKSTESNTDTFEATLGRERRRYKRIIPGQQPEPIKYRYPKEDVLGLADLLRKLIKYDPAERINTEAVMSHPWISGNGMGTTRKCTRNGNISARKIMMVSSAVVVSFVGVLVLVRRLRD
ncbi:kinase-like protein [Daldinia loculata]|nr:kinase-like protein [Daldinia loculata]